MDETIIEFFKNIYNVDTNDGAIRQIVLDASSNLNEYSFAMMKITS